MGDNTKIEWATTSWNPVVGCTPISEACDNCYARRMIRRFWKQWKLPGPNCGPIFKPERLEIPYRWKKPRRVFVCSMSDLFHHSVSDEHILKIFEVMANAQLQRDHIFMVLTKRPERMKIIMEMIRKDIEEQKKPFKNENGEICHNMVFSFPLRNIWLGVTAENQKTADKRIPTLLQIPASVRFVSIEPMLGPVDVDPYFFYGPGELQDSPRPGFNRKRVWDQTLHWVIVGAETGPGKRPMHKSWVKNISGQCRDAGVPYFFKKWGAFEDIMARELSCLECNELERREYPR